MTPVASCLPMPCAEEPQQRRWQRGGVCTQGGAGAQHVAELRAPMAAGGNSSQCIAARACLPLGAHTVWAALPPLPADADADARPLLLVLAGADGDGLFHDQIRVRRARSGQTLTHLMPSAAQFLLCSCGQPTPCSSQARSLKVARVRALGAQGAEAPLSGLVAMLAAAEALGNASAAGNYSRRLGFVALAGEPWGLMGSRRLLWQMHAGDPSVHGLRLDAVEQARRAAAHVLERLPGIYTEPVSKVVAGVTRHVLSL